jgi:glycosyltransferase involved in cell wall biosynthesis
MMVSVIIPAYNEEKALPATLSALFTQQGDYKVIVVDGGSTDRTLTVLGSFGMKLPAASCGVSQNSISKTSRK